MPAYIPDVPSSFRSSFSLSWIWQLARGEQKAVHCLHCGAGPSIIGFLLDPGPARLSGDALSWSPFMQGRLQVHTGLVSTRHVMARIRSIQILGTSPSDLFSFSSILPVIDHLALADEVTLCSERYRSLIPTCSRLHGCQPLVWQSLVANPTSNIHGTTARFAMFWLQSRDS